MQDQEYKKTFTFGKIDYNGTGRKAYAVELEVSLKINREGLPVFTASGDVWNTMRTDIVQGGQCIDSIWNEYHSQLKNRVLYMQIMELWTKWHLNDMNAGCKHQRAMHWGDKQLTIATHQLIDSVWSKQRALESKAKEMLATTGKVTVNKRDQELLNLQWRIEGPEKLPANLKKFYELKGTEQKASGWVEPSMHPEGVLTKPCPKCGYKYGTSWVYVGIETKDLKKIMELLSIPALDQLRIINRMLAEIKKQDIK